MSNLEIRKHSDILIDELRRTGHWIVANIETSMAWPVEPQEIIYDGRSYWIIPVTIDAYPGIAAQVEGINPDELEVRILRLLSVMSWLKSQGIMLVSFSGGSLPYPLGRSKTSGNVIRDKFDFSYLPVITNDDAKFALALMREGRGLNHPAYSFLSFYRVLEVAVGKGNKRKRWMPDALRRIDDHKVKAVMDEIEAESLEDLALHLFESGRCAVAHATGKTIIDPDKPSDIRSLDRKLPIMEKLAEMAIEEKLAVKTSHTIYHEHLYELQGFKKIFGLDVVNRIIRGEQIPTSEHVCIPSIGVRLRGRTPFAPFENLIAIHLSQEGTKVLLIFDRNDGLRQFRFCLNFKEERLEFDIYHDMYGPADDGSSIFADVQAAALEFTKWYFLNGCLEIVNSDTGEEIARKDAFIPVDVIVRPEGFDSAIESWHKESVSRRTVESA